MRPENTFDSVQAALHRDEHVTVEERAIPGGRRTVASYQDRPMILERDFGGESPLLQEYVMQPGELERLLALEASLARPGREHCLDVQLNRRIRVEVILNPPDEQNRRHAVWKAWQVATVVTPAGERPLKQGSAYDDPLGVRASVEGAAWARAYLEGANQVLIDGDLTIDTATPRPETKPTPG